MGYLQTVFFFVESFLETMFKQRENNNDLLCQLLSGSTLQLLVFFIIGSAEALPILCVRYIR